MKETWTQAEAAAAIKEWESAIEACMAAGVGCDRRTAVRRVVAKSPDLHAAFVSAYNHEYRRKHTPAW